MMLVLFGVCIAMVGVQLGDTITLVRAWRFRLPDSNLRNKAMARMDLRELYVVTRTALVSLLWATTGAAAALATASGVSCARFSHVVPYAGTLFVFAITLALVAAAILAVDYAIRTIVRAWRRASAIVSEVRADLLAGNFAAEFDAHVSSGTLNDEATQRVKLADCADELLKDPAIAALEAEFQHRDELNKMYS